MAIPRVGTTVDAVTFHGTRVRVEVTSVERETDGEYVVWGYRTDVIRRGRGLTQRGAVVRSTSYPREYFVPKI